MNKRCEDSFVNVSLTPHERCSNESKKLKTLVEFNSNSQPNSGNSKTSVVLNPGPELLSAVPNAEAVLEVRQNFNEMT
ncbi:hypothetical protein L596_014703 [Steinernema carpocapsae]|uniref:Uncharacterized protein n=1 Tax=Steinernema carpocapsae TaxID=34508 RepID=A0A4V6XW77_STECR|nr:hypothetical protein L596_014703 [Steinernema carpocapsae]